MGVAAYFRRVFGSLFDPATSPVFSTVSGYFGLPLVLNESFNQKNIKVFSDTFDSGVDGYQAQANVTLANVSEELEVTVTSDSGNFWAHKAYETTVDRWYTIQAKAYEGTNTGALLRYGTAIANADFAQHILTSTPTVFTTTFQATGSEVFLSTGASTASSTGTSFLDNVLIEEVPALDGWEPASSDTDVSILAGEVRIEKLTASAGYISKEFQVLSGVDYVLNLDAVSASAFGNTLRIKIGDTSNSIQYMDQQVGAAGAKMHSFHTTGATSVVLTLILTGAAATNANATFDNITIIQALVTNGTFDSDTGWTKGVGWTIAGGVATAVAGSTSSLSQGLTLEDGKTYRISGVISNLTASLVMVFAGGTEPDVFIQVTANGKFEVYLVWNTHTVFRVDKGATAAGDIDNIVITIDE